jgi:transaldolase / glucose-6-phosphate isomerase
MNPVAQDSTVATMNPLKELLKYGQSVWLDYIRRDLLIGGELKRHLDEDGLRGMTSNPTIFEKAIAGSSDYADILDAMRNDEDSDAKARYERLAIRDIQDAADILQPIYDESKYGDGYVSLEVSPYLARDTQGTIDEARRLWKAVARPNVMIKVPGTAEGIPAIQTLIGDGININVTLLFAQEVYEQAALAYIGGLEKFAAGGGDVSRVASVASFFVSRIDTAIDGQLADKLKSATDAKQQELYKGLLGKVAIANAKLAYQKSLEIYSSPRWRALTVKNAQIQRLLWASTGTKNPNYRDVLYIEELIGANTVNTIPPATFDAFRDHGKLRNSLMEDIPGAQATMKNLAVAGISMKAVTEKLTVDGCRLFSDAFDQLLVAVEKSSKSSATPKVSRQSYVVPDGLKAAVKTALDDWRANGKVRRLWQRDASLWSNTDEGKWLGWLNIADEEARNVQHLLDMGNEARTGGFSHALLLGMGGSSLCPEVLKTTFGRVAGSPELHVLDSTDPQQVKAFENKVDLAKTLFIVSSKSGSTLEPNIFKQYFFDRAQKAVGADKAGSRFVAITDPGSKMQQVAEADKFRHIFFGLPSIGGRYSALSDFGLVPAAVMGLDVRKFLDHTLEMVRASAASTAVEENPGVVLGAILGTAARVGRDKVTIITSPGISDLGAWLEQLLAESTGKEGHGIIPVDREQLAAPEIYGNDRVFAYIRLETAPDAAQETKIAALEKAGHPVVRISLADMYDLGQEFFRWEIATAVAGSIIGINAFNQPDVEASKLATRALTTEYETKGSLPAEKPILKDSGVKLFTDAKNTDALVKAAGNDKSLVGYLRAHLNRIGAGDYYALLGYIEMNGAHEEALQGIRHAVRDKKKVATCLGFGPRFLHSTGQAYKGGPNSGVFLQVTCDDSADLAVPGQKYTFGVVKAAQARGDFQVLAERNRRALRVHLGSDVRAGLATLNAAVKQALG